MKAAGATLVARETYNGRDNDFPARLLSLKHTGTKALAAFCHVRDGALVLTQRWTLGLDMPMAGTASFAIPPLPDLVTRAGLSRVVTVMDNPGCGSARQARSICGSFLAVSR